MTNPYEIGLDRNAANYVPLSPLTFLERTAAVFPSRISVIHGARRYTWAETQARCRRLASALRRRGVGKGDTVAVMAPNVPELFEAHFGVPMAGAVLNALNIRLDAETIAFILAHGEAKALITDREFSPVIEKALLLLETKPLVIDIDDALAVGGKKLGALDYEAFLVEGDPDLRRRAARGRVGGDRAQLHLGHHRQSQGRGLSPSRRLSERDREHPRVVDAAASGLSLDAADVPLQRLVLSLDRDGDGGDACLPAPRRGEADLRGDRATTASPTCAARRS